MTTIPTTRPAVHAPVRGAHDPGVTAGAIPTIDPIKLVKKYKWLLGAAAAAGAVLGVITHYTLLFAYPIYTPAAIFQTFPVETEVKSMGTIGSVKEELDAFMATQVQILTSDRIVDSTVNDPKLLTEAPRWTGMYMNKGLLDSAKAAKALKRNLSAGIMGESNFIRLGFWWTDPKDATAIVKTLSAAYLKDRELSSQEDVSERRRLLSRAINDTNDSIGKLQSKRQGKLRDQNVDTLDQAMSGELRNIATLQEKLAEIRIDKDQARSQRDQFQRELVNPAGITYPDAIRKKADEDPVVLNLKQEVNNIEAELNGMLKEFGPEHRTVRFIRGRLEAKKSTLSGERERLMRQLFDAQLDSLTTAVSSYEASENEQMKKLEESKSKAAELTQILAEVKDIDEEVKALNESRAKYGNDLKDLDILTTAERNRNRVRLFQSATEPKTVTFPRLVVMIPAGIFLVLGLAAGGVVLFEVIDQRVKSPADVAMIPKTRVLGLIPHAAEDPGAPQKVETVFRDAPGGVLAESVRQLRVTVLKRMAQAGHKSLVVMSGMPGSGATSVTINLAFAAAAAEQRVLIIDANFRRPGIHRALGLAEAPGLGDILAGSGTLAAATQKTDNPRISVLPAGSAATRVFERLGTPALAQLLQEASAGYDLVLIDVAPTMVAGDGISIANRCDASMLVVRAFGEKRGMVARLRNDLSEARAEFLGVLVNAVRSSAGGYFKSNILATHTYQNEKSKA